MYDDVFVKMRYISCPSADLDVKEDTPNQKAPAEDLIS